MRRLTLADFLLLATIIIWGLNVSAVKLLLRYFQPMGLSMLRVAMALAVFAIVVPVSEGAPRVARNYLPLLIASGVCGIWLNQVGFSYGLQRTTAASMTMLLTTIPIFAGLGAFVLGWERPGGRHWLGIVVSVAGVALVVSASPQESGHRVTLLGDLLGLVTAASWATYSLMLRPLLQVYSPYRVSLFVLLVGGLALAPLGVPQLGGTHLGSAALAEIALLIFTGVGAIALTNVLWYTGIHRLGPSRATVYLYLQPFVGVLAAVLILREPLAGLQVLGGLAILAGIALGREPQPEAARVD